MLVLGAFRCGILAFNHDSFMTSYKWRGPGTVDLRGMGNSWRGASFRAEQEPFHIFEKSCQHAGMSPRFSFRHTQVSDHTERNVLSGKCDHSKLGDCQKEAKYTQALE